MDSQDLEQQQEPRRGLRSGPIAGGVILLALGVAMFLDTTGVGDTHLGRLAPAIILIALGTAMMVERGGVVVGYRDRGPDGQARMRRRQHGSQFGGVWFIGVGAWMIASQMHVFGFNYGNSWPLFIILAGIMMIVRSAR
jgi:hypothetical protein